MPGSDAQAAPAERLLVDEVLLLEALADCLFPPEDEGPGGVSSGAVEYIKRALNAEYSHLQAVYHRGLQHIQRRSTERFGAQFTELGMREQEIVIDDLMAEAGTAQVPLGLSGAPSGAALESAGSEAAFILLMWQHIREGLYSDPRHGGNIGASVWKWLGYNGPQLHGYTESELMENRIPHRPLRTADDWLGRGRHA